MGRLRHKCECQWITFFLTLLFPCPSFSLLISHLRGYVDLSSKEKAFVKKEYNSEAINTACTARDICISSTGICLGIEETESVSSSIFRGVSGITKKAER